MGEKKVPSVLLYRARDRVEASLLVAMIEGSGVPAWTVGGQLCLAFGELGADAILVDVRVEKPDHERALELIDEYFASAKAERESDPQTPWTCEACGESVESTFSSCWKCDAPRPETKASESEV